MPKKKTRNLFEKKIDVQLKRSGLVYSYESVRFPYILAGHYTPDYVVTTKTGTLYIECKGYFRPEHKRKMAAVKRQHPEADIRIVFYNDRPKDTKWAEKHGFKWAIGKIPKEWLDGL